MFSWVFNTFSYCIGLTHKDCSCRKETALHLAWWDRSCCVRISCYSALRAHTHIHTHTHTHTHTHKETFTLAHAVCTLQISRRNKDLLSHYHWLMLFCLFVIWWFILIFVFVFWLIFMMVQHLCFMQTFIWLTYSVFLCIFFILVPLHCKFYWPSSLRSVCLSVALQGFPSSWFRHCDSSSFGSAADELSHR